MLSTTASGPSRPRRTSANGDRFKFAGMEYDSTTGQYFDRARWYGPVPGKFLSQDPIGFDASDSDLYRYARNSPLDLSDPSGLLVLPILPMLPYLFQPDYSLEIPVFVPSPPLKQQEFPQEFGGQKIFPGQTPPHMHEWNWVFINDDKLGWIGIPIMPGPPPLPPAAPLPPVPPPPGTPWPGQAYQKWSYRTMPRPEPGGQQPFKRQTMPRPEPGQGQQQRPTRQILPYVPPTTRPPAQDYPPFPDIPAIEGAPPVTPPTTPPRP